MTDANVRLSTRRRLISIHRWLGLGAALFWLVQAITGMAIVFHWEIRDAGLSDLHRPTDLAAIERRIMALAPPGTKASPGSLWTSAGFPDRYDIYFTDRDGIDRSVRIAGDGTILRGPADDGDDIPTLLVLIHHDLLADDIGEWIVGISGLLLASNLIAGLAVAWPRRGSWRAALRPTVRGPAAARLYAWHRAFGLWLVAPALLIVSTGVMLRFQDGLGGLVGASDPVLPAIAPAGDRISFAAAAAAALKAIPGSTLTSASFPGTEDATYRFRLRAPGEIRRAYGAGIVFVNANDGSVRGIFPIEEADGPRAFMSALFPVHTGEFAGLGGRLFAFAIGAWLAMMIIVGVLLWLRRRQRKTGT